MLLGRGRLPKAVQCRSSGLLAGRKREIDGISEDRETGKSSNGIRELKILLVRDDDALNALVLRGVVGTHPPHVPRGLADDPVRRAPALELRPRRARLSPWPCTGSPSVHRGCQLVAELVGLRFPEFNGRPQSITSQGVNMNSSKNASSANSSARVGASLPRPSPPRRPTRPRRALQTLQAIHSDPGANKGSRRASEE
jgi:hypothetical protein